MNAKKIIIIALFCGLSFLAGFVVNGFGFIGGAAPRSAADFEAIENELAAARSRIAALTAGNERSSGIIGEAAAAVDASSRVNNEVAASVRRTRDAIRRINAASGENFDLIERLEEIIGSGN